MSSTVCEGLAEASATCSRRNFNHPLVQNPELSFMRQHDQARDVTLLHARSFPRAYPLTPVTHHPRHFCPPALFFPYRRRSATRTSSKCTAPTPTASRPTTSEACRPRGGWWCSYRQSFAQADPCRNISIGCCLPAERALPVAAALAAAPRDREAMVAAATTERSWGREKRRYTRRKRRHCARSKRRKKSNRGEGGLAYLRRGIFVDGWRSGLGR